MTSLESMIHEKLIRFLVQKAIFCPITGEVLDYRTCTVVVDNDGDPFAVFSPELFETLQLPGALKGGYTVMNR